MIFYFSGPETETLSWSIYIHNNVEGKWDFQSAAQGWLVSWARQFLNYNDLQNVQCATASSQTLL